MNFGMELPFMIRMNLQLFAHKKESAARGTEETLRLKLPE